MGQAQAAAPVPDLSKLKSLSAQYNQFVPLHVVRKKSTCPAAASECDLYSTLYIQSDGSQCALGYVDKHNAFQPTTTAMSFAQVGEHGWPRGNLLGRWRDCCSQVQERRLCTRD